MLCPHRSCVIDLTDLFFLVQIRQALYNWRRSFLNTALSIVKANADKLVKSLPRGSSSKNAVAVWANQALSEGGEAHWGQPITKEVYLSYSEEYAGLNLLLHRIRLRPMH